MDCVVGQVQHPRLLSVAVDKGDGFVGEQIGGIAIELLHLATSIDQVVRVSGPESRLGVFVKQEIVSAHEKAKIIVKAAGLWMMSLVEALMPFADQSCGIAGSTHMIRNRPLIERQP